MRKGDLRDIALLEVGKIAYINEHSLYRSSLPKEAHAPSQTWIYSFCFDKTEAEFSTTKIDCEAYLRPVIDPFSLHLPFYNQTVRNFSEGYLVFHRKENSWWENIERIFLDDAI
ncbi:MAG: hypothetical protein AABW75_01815 [Nanoarchaeota archaeon]